MNILVTGGNGYIGSHVVAQLYETGHSAVILDDLSNSDSEYTSRINDVVGEEVPFVKADFADTKLLTKALDDHSIDGVIHFAAFKYVGESVEEPLKYYRNNVCGFVELVDLLVERDIPLIFSSSAAVYGEPPTSEVDEEVLLKPMNSYGSSKMMDEIILEAACGAKKPARGIALRYFNVVGAHKSGKLGEMLTPQSQNLWPWVVKAATGEIDALSVYGDDFDTPDGTGLRDYVHVVDLADAHIKALEFLAGQKPGYYNVFNVGTGVPTSVLDLVKEFEKQNDVKVPYQVVDRRPGDPAAYYAICKKINDELGWEAQFTIADAVKDGWSFQSQLKT